MHTVNAKLHANQEMKIGDKTINIHDIHSIVLDEKSNIVEITVNEKGTGLNTFLNLHNCPICNSKPVNRNPSTISNEVACSNANCENNKPFFKSDWQRMVMNIELMSRGYGRKTGGK